MKFWVDGCFDFFHHGHANVLFQSKTITDEPSFLEIGIHSDEDITINKGPPVMTLKERVEATKANKWCDSIYLNAPYVTFLGLIKSEKCDFVIHGDDITTDKDGNDCYQAIKDANMMKLVKRTDGVSTTEIIRRLLASEYIKDNNVEHVISDVLVKNFSRGSSGIDEWNNVWYIDISNKLQEFQIVSAVYFKTYIYGTFDLFNPFHVKALEKYRDDDSVVVGILKDGDCVMSLLQRTLCVLQCKYIRNVIIGVDKDFRVGQNYIDIESMDNEFSYLKKDGIKKRIEENLEKYQDRQKKKGVKTEIETQMC